MTIHITSKIVLVYVTSLVGHAFRHVLFSLLNIVVTLYTTFWGVCEGPTAVLVLQTFAH